MKRRLGWFSAASMLLILSLMTGCSHFGHYPVNASLEKYDPVYGYNAQNIGPEGNSEDLLLILSFSGGGIRAAAFSYEDEVVGRASVPPLMRVYSSPEKPAAVFVSDRYRDHWFFIDDRDLPSKGVFSFLMFAFTLTEAGRSKEGAPIVTIPTN